MSSTTPRKLHYILLQKASGPSQTRVSKKNEPRNQPNLLTAAHAHFCLHQILSHQADLAAAQQNAGPSRAALPFSAILNLQLRLELKLQNAAQPAMPLHFLTCQRSFYIQDLKYQSLIM